MTFPKDFLQGGVIAANQAEGAYNEDGRGLVQTDVTIGGTVDSSCDTTYIDKDGKPGKVGGLGHHAKIPEGAKFAVLGTEYYPNHVAVDFYHRYKEDIKLFAEMSYSIFHLSIFGNVFSLTGMIHSPIRLDLIFTALYSKSVVNTISNHSCLSGILIHHQLLKKTMAVGLTVNSLIFT